jgi:hypothetical protein
VAKVVFFRQCRLVKPVPTGEHVVVSWIPERFAVRGSVVRLRDHAKTWDAGWEVREVGTNRIREDDLPDFHELSKAHLRATGDAATARG